MKKLFTERHGQAKPRVAEALNDSAREALVGLWKSRINEEWFGESFPQDCPNCGKNAGYLKSALQDKTAEFGVVWPDDYLTDGQLFDLLEFSYEFVALPEAHGLRWCSIPHYSYDRAAGRDKFRDDVNRVFERNGIGFALEDGEIRRVTSAVIEEALAEVVFKTGDAFLDEILEASRKKFLSRSLAERRESLEKLWDAWERIKTVEPGKDKKARATVLLDKAASDPNFRQLLEDEAKALTQIGNTYMIRHTETDKTPITESAHVDYLFQRMFAMLMLLLKSSGRIGTTRVP
jgi:hypothetical protein